MSLYLRKGLYTTILTFFKIPYLAWLSSLDDASWTRAVLQTDCVSLQLDDGVVCVIVAGNAYREHVVVAYRVMHGPNWPWYNDPTLQPNVNYAGPNVGPASYP